MTIEELKNQIQSINQQLDTLNNRIDSLKGEKNRLHGNIEQLKDLRKREIEMAKEARRMHDTYYAQEHNFNADRYTESIDNEYGKFDYYKNQLEPLYSEKSSLLDRKKELRTQLESAYEEMNRRKAERQAMYGETRCKICGSVIRYNKTYGKIPSLCKSCHEKEEAKWKKKSCKLCGAEITYNIEWNSIPDLCKSCREKEKAKWRKKSCKNCGAEFSYNTEWNVIPDLCKSCKEQARRNKQKIFG